MLRKLWLLPVAAFAIYFSPLSAEEAKNSEFPYVGEVFDLNDDYRVRVNMRAGDGINYRILRVATEGEELIVVSKRGDWTQVRMPAGSPLSAWVKAKFLNIVNGTATVNTDRVNLRADRSLNSQALVTMKQGLELQVEKVDGAWVKVKAPADTTCWISSKFVRFKSKVSATAEVSETKKDEAGVTADTVGGTKADSKEKAGAVAIDGEAAKEKGDSPKPVSRADRLKALRQKFEEQLKAKADEESKKYDQIAVFKNQYLAVGLVVNVNDNKKASHKLEFKKRTQYFLRSAVSEDDKKILFNLNEYSGKLVGIDGKVILQQDGSRLVLVKKISVLDTPQ